jgi:hypothetical protein
MNRARFTWLALSPAVLLCLIVGGCGGPKPKLVTKENFDKLTTDMNEYDVENLLGPPMSTKTLPGTGTPVVEKTWESGSKKIILEFMNKDMVSKRSQGL